MLLCKCQLNMCMLVKPVDIDKPSNDATYIQLQVKNRGLVQSRRIQSHMPVCLTMQQQKAVHVTTVLVRMLLMKCNHVSASVCQGLPATGHWVLGRFCGPEAPGSNCS